MNVRSIFQSLVWLFRNARMFTNFTTIYRGGKFLIGRNGVKFWIATKADIPTFHEIFIEECYGALLRDTHGWRFLDIGANIGLFSLYAKFMDPSCEVIGYEPDPANCELYKKNNPGTKLVQKAVSAHSGTEELFMAHFGGQNSLVQIPGAQTLTVQTADLDSIIDGIDAVKLDIEGAELRVLSACTRLNTLKRIAVETEAELIEPIRALMQKSGFKEIGESVHDVFTFGRL